MSRKLISSLAMSVWGISVMLSQPVQAQTPITRAVIQALRNQVRLVPQNQAARPARISDTMTPGDALTTARSALAELRFNDGSLARLGEQALFQFVPNTRTFKLSDGTLLLLVPPGQGHTHIRTPNAAAGIRGSALFARYIPESNTTIVGALTNNPQGPMVIFNQDGSQSQDLKAGQLAVIVAGRIERLYEFDLKTFYDTSDLVKGLNLTAPNPTLNSDEAIAAVQLETAEAVAAQTPLVGDSVIENPGFIRMSVASELPTLVPTVSPIAEPPMALDRAFNPASQLIDTFTESLNFRGNFGIQPVLEGGEIQSVRSSEQPFPGGGRQEFPGRGREEFPGQGRREFPGQGRSGPPAN